MTQFEENGPVLDQVNLIVGDMDAMVAFYRRLGVKIPDSSPEWAAWDEHHRSAARDTGADLDLDSRTFASMWDQGWSPTRAGLVLGFRLPHRDAVDRTYAELTGAGHTGQQPPYDAFWGARYAVVEDPDGNAVGLMSPVDPERRSEGPDPTRSPGTA